MAEANAPRVSVVIPVKDGERYLEELLDALAVDELHRDPVRAVVLADAEDRDDVGIDEARGGLRLALTLPADCPKTGG